MTTETAALTVVSSVSLKLLGKNAAAKLLAMPETVRERYFGRIYGTATGVGTSERTTQSGEQVVDVYLKGEFGLDKWNDDEKRIEESFTSGRVYLADAIGQPITASFYDENGELAKGHRVVFAFDIYAKRDGNAAGFTWYYKPLVPQESKSPLDLLRDKIAGRGHMGQVAKQLEHHKA